MAKHKSGAGKMTYETIKRLEGLRKGVTQTVSFRLDPRDVDRLRAIAKKRKVKVSQLVKEWVLERLNS